MFHDLKGGHKIERPDRADGTRKWVVALNVGKTSLSHVLGEFS